MSIGVKTGPDERLCPKCGALVQPKSSHCHACGFTLDAAEDDDMSSAGFEFLTWDGEEPVLQSGAGGWKRRWFPSIALIAAAAFLASVVPRAIYVIPLLLLGAAAAYYAVELRAFAGRISTRSLEKELLLKLRGDRGAMEGLIRFERQRHPGFSRRQLLKMAIDRRNNQR